MPTSTNQEHVVREKCGPCTLGRSSLESSEGVWLARHIYMVGACLAWSACVTYAWRHASGSLWRYNAGTVPVQPVQYPVQCQYSCTAVFMPVGLRGLLSKRCAPVISVQLLCFTPCVGDGRVRG
jgi:hypothetical protein